MMVISHRGASGYAPENTLPAFEKALAMGSRAFEFDVQRSKDGKLLVHHDYDFLRTAGINKKVAELSYSEIERINAAKHFKNGPEAKAPLLSEVLSLINDRADFINVEIKNDGNIYPGIEEEILKELENHSGAAGKTVISSFYFPSLERIRAISSSARLAYLGHKLAAVLIAPAAVKAKRINCENFHLSRKISFSVNLKIIMSLGFKVCVYTVNERKEAEKLKDIGVHGIFSNYPDIMEKN